MVVVIILAVILIITAFVVVNYTFSKWLVYLSEDLVKTRNELEDKKRDLHLISLLPPKIQYVHPEVITVGNTAEIERRIFNDQDHKDYHLRQIAHNLGEKLLELKVIDFEVFDQPNPVSMNTVKLYSEIKILKTPNDKRN